MKYTKSPNWFSKHDAWILYFSIIRRLTNVAIVLKSCRHQFVLISSQKVWMKNVPFFVRKLTWSKNQNKNRFLILLVIVTSYLHLAKEICNKSYRITFYCWVENKKPWVLGKFVWFPSFDTLAFNLLVAVGVKARWWVHVSTYHFCKAFR